MQVWDTRASLAALRELPPLGRLPVSLRGARTMSVVALFAALFEDGVKSLELERMPSTLAQGPSFPNALRFFDLPQLVALVFPRAINLTGADPGDWEWSLKAAKLLGGTITFSRDKTASVPGNEKAAIVRISDDGKLASFDPQQDFIDFPGGSKKFTIRWDAKSKNYWALANYFPEQHRRKEPSRTHNTLALIRSIDLRNWEVRAILLYHPDTTKHGFQYADWLFEGNDLIAVVRTAFDDAADGAHNQHDANYLMFHRIRNFRRLTMKDSVAFISPE
jgi:hypothetical protein